jgi:membrane associated rhomboid family serine protease
MIPRRPIGLRLVVAYAIAVLALDRLVASGWLDLDSIAESPHGLLHGRLWTVLTSALVTEGSEPIFHVALLASALAVLATRQGMRRTWSTALAAHVGSALLAYCGLLVVIATGVVQGSSDLTAPDYGISCVWFGCLGALVCGALRDLDARSARLVLAASLVAIVASKPIGTDVLTAIEHVLALSIGAAMGLRAVAASPLREATA